MARKFQYRVSRGIGGAWAVIDKKAHDRVVRSFPDRDQARMHARSLNGVPSVPANPIPNVRTVQLPDSRAESTPAALSHTVTQPTPPVTQATKITTQPLRTPPPAAKKPFATDTVTRLPPVALERQLEMYKEAGYKLVTLTPIGDFEWVKSNAGQDILAPGEPRWFCVYEYVGK